MQVVAAILRDVRESQKGCSTVRGFLALLQQETKEVFGIGTLQDAEAAGTVRDHRHDSRAIVNSEYIRCVCELDGVAWDSEKLMKVHGGWVPDVEPLGDRLRRLRDELGKKEFHKKYTSFALSEEDIILYAMRGLLREPMNDGVSRLLNISLDELQDAAIAQKHSFLFKELYEAPFIPVCFGSVAEIVQWAIDQYGESEFRALTPGIEDDRLRYILQGSDPTKAEAADVARALKVLSKDDRFNADYLLSIDESTSASQPKRFPACD